jgi:hypothetical protein
MDKREDRKVDRGLSNALARMENRALAVPRAFWLMMQEAIAIVAPQAPQRTTLGQTNRPKPSASAPQFDEMAAERGKSAAIIRLTLTLFATAPRL